MLQKSGQITSLNLVGLPDFPTHIEDTGAPGYKATFNVQREEPSMQEGSMRTKPLPVLFISKLIFIIPLA